MSELERLVGLYQGPLTRMCYVYLQDAALAQDAVQETFLKAYRNLTHLRDGQSEKAWLMAIAVNTCRDMRRSAWQRHMERHVTPEELPMAAPQENIPGENADALALGQAIGQLPRRHRDAVLLYYYQDLTIQEVADALHAAPSTIVKRLKQAREKLRAELERGMHDD